MTQTLVRTLMITMLACGAIAAGTRAATPLKRLHSFCDPFFACNDGEHPQGPLSLDLAGNVYGVAQGGVRLGGVVFEIIRGAGQNKFRVLFSFCRDGYCPDGANPMPGLVIDTSGNVYGVTNSGGSESAGTLFELTHGPNGTQWRHSVLHNFCTSPQGNCLDGWAPTFLTYAGAQTGAPYDGVSPLYGVTTTGGRHSGGVVFSFTPHGSAWTETALYHFCAQANCADGKHPNFLVPDGSGNLAGTTTDGGNSLSGGVSGGVVFKLSPAAPTWSENVLYKFCSEADCADGAHPYGVVPDSAGNLFGTTNQGGLKTFCYFGCGVLYELSPAGAETVLHTFCPEKRCVDGSTPTGALAMDGTGSLFGMTSAGAWKNYGTVFRWSAGTFQKVRGFCFTTNCTLGAVPYGGLTIEPSGNLIGATYYGGQYGLFGGTVFEMTP